MPCTISTCPFPGGEYISIMGPSGSGKSTLLNILGLLDRPSQGIYRFDEVDTTTLNDIQQAEVRRHKIGFVFQFFHLIPRLTAAENVELPLILAGENPSLRRQRVREALARMGLSERGAAPAGSAFRRPAPAYSHCPGDHHESGGHPGG